jgi:mono/diheme cytochrome c family protein
MRWLAVPLAASLLVGCSKDRATSAPPDAAAAAVTPPATAAGDAGPALLSSDDGRTLVKNACLSCHSEEMLLQQRLTPAQWSKVVTKMAGWGANLEPNEAAPLAAWLAATYGPDAGPYEPTPMQAGEAAAEIAPLPDGLFAGGDAERGRPLYIDKCSGCHGADARGHIGVLLIDRPFLYRAADFADTIRRGRGKMTPIALSDPEIADILAHLRRLK